MSQTQHDTSRQPVLLPQCYPTRHPDGRWMPYPVSSNCERMRQQFKQRRSELARALTVRTIETLKPVKERREIPDAYLPGLYLIVQPSGAKAWAVRYRHGRRPASTR